MNLSFDRVIKDYVTPPAVLERNKGNMYLYRYDIVEASSTEPSDDDIPVPEGTKYSFVEVLLPGYPNKNEVIKYLIRKLVSLEDELKIINDYNEVLHLDPDYVNSEEYKTYMEYLRVRHEIKSKLKTDFDNYSI